MTVPTREITQKTFVKRFAFSKVLLTAVIAVIIGGFIASQLLSQEEVTTYEVTRGPISQVVTASGNVSSAGTLDVYTSANGVITEYFVQNGQTVDKDTPLFAITSTATPQEKEAAKAAYATAIDEYNTAKQNQILYQAQLEEARAAVLGQADAVNDFTNRTDNPDQIDKDIINSADWSTRRRFDQAEKKYVDAQQSVQAKSQNITAKKAAVDATQDQIVTSSVPGTIANINPQLGDEVYIVTSTKSEPVLTLTNFDTYTVEVFISENDIYRVALGQMAEIRMDSLPDRMIYGKVSKVDTIGEIDNGLVTYTVTIDLDESDTRMRAGMTADVNIITETKPEVLLIPNAALDQNDEGKVVYVQIGKGKEYQVNPVIVGIKGKTHSEIVSGLDGTEILIDPLDVTSSKDQ